MMHWPRQAFLATILAAGAAMAQDPEQVDRAHRKLFEAPESKSANASRLTAEVVQPAREARTAPAIPRKTYIDTYVFGRMERDGVPHAAPANDEEFARRAWIDATGRIPEPAELLAFLDDPDPEKRAKLIDRLTDSPAFIDRWTFYFEDLFRAGGRMGPGLNLFHYWVREWLTLDRPYNEVVTDMLTASGKTSFSSPGSLYVQRDFVKAKDDPEAPDAHDLLNVPDTIDEFTVTYGKVFLGMNFACISCHDGKGHLEKVNLYLAGKTREQFFRQSGFFGKTRIIMNWEDGYQANTEYTVDDTAPGYDTKAASIVRVPRMGGSASPQFILSGEAPRPNEHWRDGLARILTGDIQFSRAFTNRIWAELMGFGIVEPVDEFDLARYDPKHPPPAPWTIQPSNPELLDAMARDFQAGGYSFRRFVKTVMQSSAYQLSSRFDGQWKPEYANYYARKFVRMLSAAELHDAVATATGAANQPLAQALADPKKLKGGAGGFMKVFGQSNRDDMPKRTPPSTLQAMLLMQSKLVTENVRAREGNRTGRLLAELADDRALVSRLYLATLSRRPDDRELDTALRSLKPDRKRGLENLQWALINSPEFVFNY
jgi:hypothetical protein